MKKSLSVLFLWAILALVQGSVWACGLEAPGAGSPAEQEETAVEETV